MYSIKAVMISAIVACILLLGGMYYSDRRSQNAYAVWAHEQNRILNESQKAAKAEIAKKAPSDNAKVQDVKTDETSPAAGEYRNGGQTPLSGARKEIKNGEEERASTTR